MTTDSSHILYNWLFYCSSPDDDDFVWPPTGYWTGKRKLEVEDADTERLLKDKKLPSGGMCAYW